MPYFLLYKYSIFSFKNYEDRKSRINAYKKSNRLSEVKNKINNQLISITILPFRAMFLGNKALRIFVDF